MIREVILPVAEWQPRDRLHLIWAGFQAVAGLAVVVWLVVCLRRDGSGKAFDPLTRTLLLTGSGYLILIVAIRWTAAFDGFGFLQMVRRKVSWIRRHVVDLQAVASDAG